MGGSSSSPVASDAGGSAAIVTQAPAGGCPVQHSSSAPNRTSKSSTSECPVHQDSMVKLQASQCPISAGSGCDSAAIDKGADALDPANMVKVAILLLAQSQWISNDKIEKIRLNFSIHANHDITPLISVF